MHGPLHFAIHAAGTLSESVLALGLTRFDQLAAYVQLLPYGRTSSAADPRTVLKEGCGTCSSKHQLLAAVAHECGHHEVQLTVGIYQMSEQNTPAVGPILSSASLSSVPEAHCYLTVGGERFDFTGLPPGSSSPFESLLAEHLVSPTDLPRTKARLHMHAMVTWAAAVGVSTESAWATREACIAALSKRQEGPRAQMIHLPDSTTRPDAFDLGRFLEAQTATYADALSELQSGRKRTHWMWFIFPQIDGLGSSSTARRYAIKSLDEARAYLGHPVLGQRLVECTGAVNRLQGHSAHEIFGSPDDMKFHSSMTLFDLAAGSASEFSFALDKYFAGERDARTLELLGLSRAGA